MSLPSQEIITQLILRNIGGSRIKGSAKFDVLKQKVVVQASSLQGIADKLKQFGDTVEEVRNTVLQNPKDAVIGLAKANISALKDKLI